MSETNNHIQFSGTDIEKYWKGLLPSATMHAMEKAAMEDPFLADAMEGYQSKMLHKKEAVAPDIQELSKRLQERVERDKVVTMPRTRNNWWRVAAAAIVLIGGGALAFQFFNTGNKQREKDIAVVSPASTEATNNNIIIADSARQFLDVSKKKDSSALVSDIAAIETNKVAAATQANTDLTLHYKQTDTTTNNPIPDAVVRNANQPATAPIASDDVAKEKETKAALAKREAEIPVAAANDKSKSNEADADFKRKDNLAGKTTGSNQLNVFNGRVIDQNNQAVAGAIVRFPVQKQTISTDANGLFNFSAPDTVLTASITSVGYETQNLSLRNNGFISNQDRRTRNNQSAVENQIQLKPQNDALEEVVVSGYGTQKKGGISSPKTKGIDVDVLEASPVIKVDEYNNYLEKNKVLIDEVKNIHGTVVVSFTVTKRGLNDFKIEQHLHEYLDAEAIRLVKEGPGWKLLKGKKARVSVMVNF
jgi:hypothetical protein